MIYKKIDKVNRQIDKCIDAIVMISMSGGK